MIDRKKLDEIIAKDKITDQEYIRMCDDNIDMLTVEVWQLKEKLNIAVKALEAIEMCCPAGGSIDEWKKKALFNAVNTASKISTQALNQIRGKGK